MCLPQVGELQFQASVDAKDFLDEGPFPTFTTSRPRDEPGVRLAGFHTCETWERSRWIADRFRFFCTSIQGQIPGFNKHGDMRVPNIQEREVMMGFPLDYTLQCLFKSSEPTAGRRLSALPTWSIVGSEQVSLRARHCTCKKWLKG